MSGPIGIPPSPASVLMLAGQLYAADPTRWETAGGRIMYGELAHMAWSLAGAVMNPFNQTGYSWEAPAPPKPEPWDREPK